MRLSGGFWDVADVDVDGSAVYEDEEVVVLLVTKSCAVEIVSLETVSAEDGRSRRRLGCTYAVPASLMSSNLK